MKEYSAVLFDLDGTLIYSHPGICSAASYALAKKGIFEEDPEKLKRFIGPPLYHSFSKLYGFSTEEAVECVEIYREYYGKQGVFEYELIDGMDEVVKMLKQQGKKVYLATGKPQEYAEIILDRLGLTAYFDGIVGSNMDGTRITKPEVIETVLKTIPKDCPIMVGDTYYDIEGANQYHIDSIGVTFGYGTRESMEEYAPTYLVESVIALKNLLKRI